MVFRYTFLQLSGFSFLYRNAELTWKKTAGQNCVRVLSLPRPFSASHRNIWLAPSVQSGSETTEPPVSVEKQAVPFLFISPGSVYTGSFRTRIPDDPAHASRW